MDAIGWNDHTDVDPETGYVRRYVDSAGVRISELQWRNLEWVDITTMNDPPTIRRMLAMRPIVHNSAR